MAGFKAFFLKDRYTCYNKQKDRLKVYTIVPKVVQNRLYDKKRG